MNGSNHLPTVFILRQAMDVIRREALKFDIETGGILIGSRSADGAVLVTHATPPGPAAVHNAVYFKRDVAYQQAALNSLHRRYGVQYLGEWHKHPRNLPVPSGGDFQGVRDLLADPDYGVNDLLFPIIICEPDLGFQIHPFYVCKMDIQAAFQPMKWYELPLAVDMDQVFYLSSVSGQTKENEGPSAQSQSAKRPDRQRVPRQTRGVGKWTLVERYLPFFSRPSAAEPVAEEKPPTEAKGASKATEPTRPDQWYESDAGRQRLAHEQKLLKSFGLVSQPFTIGDSRLCFSFPRGGGREIVVICAADHPAEPPRFLIRECSGEKHRPLPPPTWNSDTDFLADAIVPMLGPNVAVPDPRAEDTVGATHTEGEQK